MAAIPLSRQARTQIEDGVADGWAVRDAVAVEVQPDRRNDRGWPVLVVAALMNSPAGPNRIAVFATGEDEITRFGPIIALDDTARECTSWGAAANPGSPMDRNRLHILGFPEVDEARHAFRDQLIAQLVTTLLEDLLAGIDRLLDERDELADLAARLRVERDQLEADLEQLRSVVGSLKPRLSARALRAAGQLVMVFLTTAVASGVSTAVAIELTDETPATAALVETCDDIIRRAFEVDE